MNHSELSGYKMSFTTGGLLLAESVAMAGLHGPGESWSCTIARAQAKGATALPKVASNRRILREIANRLSVLRDVELAFLVWDADRVEAQVILWLASCRAYRFIREFSQEVIAERYLSYRLDLPNESFDIFLESKAEGDEKLASLTASTKAKLRQVMFRMMREAGIISNAKQIQTAVVSPRLKIMIEENRPEELSYFPGYGRAGV